MFYGKLKKGMYQKTDKPIRILDGVILGMVVLAMVLMAVPCILR